MSTRTTTRTDAIIAEITRELRARSAEIDAEHGLSSVSLIVKLDRKTGRPGEVLFRKESQRRVQTEAT